MAPLTQSVLSLLSAAFLLGFLSDPAAARPCKTLFISSYSVSFHPNFPDQNNPNSAGTAGILTIFTEIRQFNPRPPLTFVDTVEDQHPIERPPRFGLGLGFDSDSLRDRTKDVLSVVVALLFGVGCGALTAATMYLGWSLFSNRHRYSDFDYDDFEDDDVDMSPKKVGYVRIPPPADASTPVAKEAVWGTEKLGF